MPNAVDPAMTEKEQMYRDLFALQAQRGVSLSALSRESGIPSGTLSWWKKEIRRRALRRGAPQQPAFVPVTVESARRPVADAGFDVLLPNRVRLHVPTDFDADDLQRLVTTLVSTC